MAETSLDIKIRPGIAPDSRHSIEDKIASLGIDVAGGGGFDDGSESDIMAYSTNVNRDLPKLMNVLRGAAIGQQSVIVIGGVKEQKVYGDFQTVSTKPWWKFW